jgi:hypothetical protein
MLTFLLGVGFGIVVGMVLAYTSIVVEAER